MAKVTFEVLSLVGIFPHKFESTSTWSVQGEGSRSGANRAQNAARSAPLVWQWGVGGWGSRLGRFGVIGVTKHAYSSPLNFILGCCIYIIYSSLIKQRNT